MNVLNYILMMHFGIPVLNSIRESLNIQFCLNLRVHDIQIKLIFISSRTQLQSEEIVADLVHCFLLPEVKKTTMREKGKILRSFHTDRGFNLSRLTVE